MFQPRFTLRGLFALVTFCAVGTWYWYQRPYPVEGKVESLWGICAVGRRPPDPPPAKNFREVRYFRRVWGKRPLMHGPYRGYDLKGNLLKSGYYVNGKEHGQFIDHWPDGAKTTWKMVQGRREGETRSVDGKGTLRALAFYVNGEQHGTGRSWDAGGDLFEEENYEAGVLHGRVYWHDEMGRYSITGQFEHGTANGQWKCLLQTSGIQEVRGEWRDGVAVGRWEWQTNIGDIAFATEFIQGKITRVEPCDFSVRVADELLQPLQQDPRMLPYVLGPSNTLVASEPKLEDLVNEVCYEMHLVPDSLNLELVGLKGTATVTERPANSSSALALYETLKARGLGYDVRYGEICIEPLASIHRWNDSTGVTSITPPPKSKIAAEWNSSTIIDVVEMPLRYVMLYLAETHSIQFDTSLLPETATSGDNGTTLETPVTISIRSLPLRHTLGVLLKQVNCRAILRGETIVIERP